MKYIALLLALVVVTKCEHMFMGTNVMKNLVHHTTHQFRSSSFANNVEFVNYTMAYSSQTIQGILAYDQTQGASSANVTRGGVGYSYVNIRLKSGTDNYLFYDLYIYS